MMTLMNKNLSLTFSTVEDPRLLEGADAGIHQLQAGGQLVFNVLLSIRWNGKRNHMALTSISGID